MSLDYIAHLHLSSVVIEKSEDSYRASRVRRCYAFTLMHAWLRFRANARVAKRYAALGCLL